MQLRAAWFGAVIATTLVFLLSGTVFVLAQAFSSDPAAPPSPAAAPSPSSARTTPTRAWKPVEARVMGVRAGKEDPRAVVLAVALPSGCARGLHARVVAENPERVVVRARLERLLEQCPTVSRTLAATARAPLAGRTVVVNGDTWVARPTGAYVRCPACD